MKKIPLTQGKFALVDDEDFEQLSKYKWFMSTGYAGRNRIYGSTLMHRVILKATPSQEIDHINGNPLDNRRSNLRFATKQQNGFNRGKNKNNKSGFKGVAWHGLAGRWVAHITVNRKQIYLGSYDEKEEAHAAYCIAAEKYCGEFAHS